MQKQLLDFIITFPNTTKLLDVQSPHYKRRSLCVIETFPYLPLGQHLCQRKKKGGRGEWINIWKWDSHRRRNPSSFDKMCATCPNNRFHAESHRVRRKHSFLCKKLHFLRERSFTNMQNEFECSVALYSLTSYKALMERSGIIQYIRRPLYIDLQ